MSSLGVREVAAVFRLAWERKLRNRLRERDRTCSEEAAFEIEQSHLD